MLRVLRPGGKFAIMEPNWIFPTNFIPSKINPMEKNISWIKPGNFESVLTQIPDLDFQIQHFSYAPPFPAFLRPFYDCLDKIISRIPILNNFSIMIFVSGYKK
jgi:hypothetical protein